MWLGHCFVVIFGVVFYCSNGGDLVWTSSSLVWDTYPHSMVSGIINSWFWPYMYQLRFTHNSSVFFGTADNQRILFSLGGWVILEDNVEGNGHFLSNIQTLCWWEILNLSQYFLFFMDICGILSLTRRPLWWRIHNNNLHSYSTVDNFYYRAIFIYFQ